MRYEKIIFNGQRRNRGFLIVIYHSSLVKGAMNAASLCKLRNGVKKTPQKSYRMSLISARSISLDSTFKLLTNIVINFF